MQTPEGDPRPSTPHYQGNRRDTVRGSIGRVGQLFPENVRIDFSVFIPYPRGFQYRGHGFPENVPPCHDGRSPPATSPG